MKIRLLVLFFIFFSLELSAQKANSNSDYFNNFSGIYSKGEIPSDFISTIRDKVTEDHEANFIEKEKKSTKRKKKQFLLQTNYYLDQLLKGGRVLFNDTLSDYINKVAAKVLKSRPELKKELRFYVIKSPYVNAFATDKGIVLINIGLLAQLENEAQLAYIISHEIVHYINKHSMEEFSEELDIKKQRGKYTDLRNAEDKLLAKSRYSKEKELEADRIGLKDFFAKTEYSLDAINTTFDVLQFSFLPFNEEEFEKSYFENTYRKFPEEYFLKEVKPISDDANYNDSLSTHPNIAKRKEILKENLKTIGRTGGQKYLVSKEQFNFVRNAARFELIKLYLMKADYAPALYSIYLLRKEFPDNKYLARAQIACLYGFARHKTFNYQSTVLGSYKKIEGNSQQLYHLLAKISKTEVTALALDYAFKEYQKDTSNIYYERVVKDLMYDMCYTNKVKIAELFTSEELNAKIEAEKHKTEAISDTAIAKAEDDEDPDSKYNKIRNKKVKVENPTEKKADEKDGRIYKMFLCDVSGKEAFIDLYKGAFEHAEKRRKEENESTVTYANESEGENYYYYYGFEDNITAKQSKQFRRKGYGLGIDNVIIYKPTFLSINSKKGSINMDKADQERDFFNVNLKSCLTSTGIKSTIIDPHHFTETESDKFNDMCIISEWYEEELGTKVRIVPFGMENLKKVCLSSNSNYINLTGMVSFNMQREYDATVMCYSVLLFPTLPFYLYWQLHNMHKTYYYSKLFDVKNNTWLIHTEEVVDSKPNASFIKSHLYDSFHQIIKSNTRNKK